ncbi:TadC protein [Agromyces bauzanensis]
MWPYALAIGAVAGLGIALLIAELAPRRPSLAAALDRLGGVDVVTAPDGSDADAKSRLGLWGQRHLAGRPGFTVPRRDLMILEKTPTEFFATKLLLLMLLGVLVPVLLSLVAWATNLGPLFTGGAALLSIPLALVGVLLADTMVRQEAAEARQEAARGVAVYLELVATQRHRGSTAAVALEMSATISDTWVFRRIREVLHQARLSGIQPWDALAQLSEETGVPELNDVADIMRLSGEGTAVYQPLRKRGQALRVQLLNQEHLEANRLSERMTYPQTLLGVIFLAILVTPPLMQLMAS